MWREDKLPLVDFYQLCSKAASRLGYEIIICLVARYSDVPEIYQNLERQWSSLHDVTGKSILFLFAGDNVDNYVDSATVLYEDSRNSEQAAIYSDTLAVLSSYNENSLKINPSYDWYLKNLKKGIPRLEKGHDIIRSHTIQISQLKKFLNLKEKDIPCLHIHYLTIEVDKIITLDETSNVYQILKLIQKEFEDNNIIVGIRKYLNEINTISSKLRDLEYQLSNLQKSSNSRQKKYECVIKRVCELQVKDKVYFESFLQEILDLENRESLFLLNDKRECFKKVKTIGEILDFCDDFRKFENAIKALISKVQLGKKIAAHQENLNKQQENLEFKVTKYTEIIKKLSETFSTKESQIQQKQNIVPERHDIIEGNYVPAQQVIIIAQQRTAGNITNNTQAAQTETNHSAVKTILILTSNPRNTSALRLDEEVREIEALLQRAKKRELFDLKQRRAVRVQDVYQSLLDFNPKIVHFSGHGRGDDGLVLEDEAGSVRLVETVALAGLFELFAPQIECVVLNACYSEVQAEAIAQHIPYVIGMSKEIGDQAAIKFATGFYSALGAGESVEFAYKLGCNVIQLEGIPEHLSPKLKKR